MAYGKTIELYLVDGAVDGLVVAELSNWNGEAIKVPRTQVADYGRDDLSRPGVYFLLCGSNEADESVYVGEAENVLARLKQHVADWKAGKKDYYWNTAVAFLGAGLDKASIRYLEHQLRLKVEEAGRYKLETKATYKNTVLKESKRATLEEYMDNVTVLMGALGYRVFSKAPEPEPTTNFFRLQTDARGGADARGFQSARGFTVCKGSRVTTTVTPSFENAKLNGTRKKLMDTGVIEDCVFTMDYEFSSPSAAAEVLRGCSANGRLLWKDEQGRTLGEVGG